MLDWPQAAFVTIFGIVMVVFSIVDFNHFLDPESFPSAIKWENDRDVWGMETWRMVLMTFSGVSSFSGALTVFLAALGRHSTWSWGFVNTIFYGAFAFAYGYAGDAQLYYLYFLPAQLVGMVAWERRLDDEGTAHRRPSMGPVRWLVALLGSGAVFAFFFYEIPAFSRALGGYYVFEGEGGAVTVPWVLDGLSNAFNVGGQILMIQRQWEQWLFWIAVNVIQIAMFSGVAGFGVDFNILCMFGFFMVNSLYGLWAWYHRPVKHTRDQYDDMYDLGVIVGKFYPPHLGHEYLVKTGLLQCKRLVVIVCVKPEESPNRERASWLQENCPGADVVVFDQVEDMDDTDSVLWAEKTLEILGGATPDACFTSESYGEPFAKALTVLGTKRHVEDVRVDQPRKTFPISGTSVREDPYAAWNFLSANVRQFYSQLVVLVGAESTGKSTLANIIAERFSEYSPILVEEHGRLVSERKPDPYQDWTEDDFLEIASVQTENITNAMQKSFLVVGDTDARATAAWQDYLMGKISPEIEDYATNSPIPALFILCPVDGAAFVQDGTRKDGDHRVSMERQLRRRCMQTTRAKLVELQGDSWEDRTKHALQSVEDLLHTTTGGDKSVPEP